MNGSRSVRSDRKENGYVKQCSGCDTLHIWRDGSNFPHGGTVRICAVPRVGEMEGEFKMKISAVKAICKREKFARIFNERREDGTIKRQFLATSRATYPIENMPLIDEKNLMTIFDVPEKQREKWNTGIVDIPETMSFEDYTKDEEQVEESTVEIVAFGKVLKALHTRDGVLFVDTEMLKPIAGNMDMLTFWTRKDSLGATYIAAKIGMSLCAIIWPCYDIDLSFANALDRLAQDVLAEFTSNSALGEDE